MSHTLKKIPSLRKLHQKYVELRGWANEDFNKTYDATTKVNESTISWVSDQGQLGQQEVMATSSDMSNAEDKEWEEPIDYTGGTEHNGAGPGDNDVQMDLEITYNESGNSTNGNGNNEEDMDDAALGEDLELSELLQLEKEQPDDLLFSNQEFPTRPKSPNNTESENVPVHASTITFDPNEPIRSIEFDERRQPELPPSEFAKTDVLWTDGEIMLRKLLPYKKYQVKCPSCLRVCYTVIVQGDAGTVE